MTSRQSSEVESSSDYSMAESITVLKTESDVRSMTSTQSWEVESSGGSINVLRREGEEPAQDVDKLQQECEEAIERVKDVLKEGQGNRPLVVLIIGVQGSGKSSFICSVAAAFSQKSWHEHAGTGLHDDGRPITVDTQSFQRCGNARSERYQDVLLPTLIDVAGSLNIKDDTMVELLRLLMYGHIREDSAIMEAYDYCCTHSKDEIRLQYSKSYARMKVDRVVVVASAADNIPVKLIECVIEAARPPYGSKVKRAIPVFGVLTKKDLVDVKSQEFQERKKTFMRTLGIPSTRFLCCSNYCDDTDPEAERLQQVLPDLDLPILKFFHQVCDPAHQVRHAEERLPSLWKSSLLVALALGGVTWCLVWLALFVSRVLLAVRSPEVTTLVEACAKGLVADAVAKSACAVLATTAVPLVTPSVVGLTAALGYFLLSRVFGSKVFGGKMEAALQQTVFRGDD